MSRLRSTLIHLKDKYYHRSEIQKCRRILDEHERRPAADQFAKQKERLAKLLTRAANEVPYYRDMFRELGFEENADGLIRDYHQIPFLTRQLIRENFDRLKNHNLNDYRWFLNKTGGSTGEPLLFIQDWDYSDFNMAMTQKQFCWAGERDDNTHVKLWGSQDDILRGSLGLKARMSNWLYKTVILNSFCMTTTDMQNYVDIIQNKTPVLIEAYADSAYELSSYINQRSISMAGLTGVMTSAGTLFPFMRAEIEKAFRCKVFNRYGSREMGAMACEKESGKGLYVSTYTHFIEVVNEKGDHCEPGEEGEIIVTCLTNHVFPLIRYRIGDRGIVRVVFNDQVDSCFVLENVSGRVTDSFVRRDGTVISSAFFIHFLGVVFNSGWLEKVQIIQRDYELVEVKMVVSLQPAPSDLSDLRTTIQKVMGKNCEVVFDLVDEIPKLSSGKYQYTKTLVRKDS